MESFSQIISRLLLKHNCVVIPDFGGFVARSLSAEIDEKHGLITPPRKAILFNPHLLTSDGLLVTEYALSNQITFTESQLKIHEIVKLWLNELNSGNRIAIDKVGELFINETGKLCFEQDRFFNLLLSSYGLGNVKFSVVQKIQDSIEENVEVSIEKSKKTILERTEEQVDLSIIEHPVKLRTNKWKVALTAACILPLAFYSFWIPTRTNVLESGVISVDDFNPFNQNEISVYSEKTIPSGTSIFTDKPLEDQLKTVDPSSSTFSYEFDESLYITIPLHQNSSEKINVVQIPDNNPSLNNSIPEVNTQIKQTEPSQATPENLIFEGVKPGVKYAIIGCFSEVGNAKKYVVELNEKGFNAKFLDFNKGLYRISVDEASSIDSLQSTIQKAASSGYNTWILK